MKGVIKRAARTFNAVSMVVEETAINGVNIMSGLSEASDAFRKDQFMKYHFRTIKKETKWKKKAAALGTEMPEIPELKL